jgi:hypothetical protein
MEKTEVLMLDFICFYPLFLKVIHVTRSNTVIIYLVLSIASSFQKVLIEVYEVKSFWNWPYVMAAINSSGFGMNGFMSEAFENPEGLFFGNVGNL